MSEIDGLIQRLDSWLKENRPDYYATLPPGATNEEICAFEDSFGKKVPADFVQFLKWKNIGTESSWEEFLPGQYGYSLNEIQKERSELKDFESQNFTLEDRWHSGFIPFVKDGSRDFWVIDSCGLYNGIPNQIIPVSWELPPSVEAPSFLHWLKIVVFLLEDGAWERDQLVRIKLGSTNWPFEFGDMVKKVNPGYPWHPKEENL